MAPSQCSILLAACSDDSFAHDKVGFWKDVYGEGPFFCHASGPFAPAN
jgi:hypothetical protein